LNLGHELDGLSYRLGLLDFYFIFLFKIISFWIKEIQKKMLVETQLDTEFWEVTGSTCKDRSDLIINYVIITSDEVKNVS
jgi:hypothetical protein